MYVYIQSEKTLWTVGFMTRLENGNQKATTTHQKKQQPVQHG